MQRGAAQPYSAPPVAEAARADVVRELLYIGKQRERHAALQARERDGAQGQCRAARPRGIPGRRISRHVGGAPAHTQARGQVTQDGQHAPIGTTSLGAACTLIVAGAVGARIPAGEETSFTPRCGVCTLLRREHHRQSVGRLTVHRQPIDAASERLEGQGSRNSRTHAARPPRCTERQAAHGECLEVVILAKMLDGFARRGGEPVGESGAPTVAESAQGGGHSRSGCGIMISRGELEAPEHPQPQGVQMEVDAAATGVTPRAG